MRYFLDRALSFRHLPSLFNPHHPQTWWFDLFVGIPPLIVLPAALLIRPDHRVWILTGIAVLAVWVAIGDEGGGLLPALDHAPGFTFNRKAYRYAALMAIVAGPLAARGISGVLATARAPAESGPFRTALRNRIYAGATLALALAAVLILAPEVPAKGAANTVLGARLVPYLAAGTALVLGLTLAVPRLGARLALVPLLLIGIAQAAQLYWSAEDRLKLNQSVAIERERRYLEQLPIREPAWRVDITGPRIGFGSRELLRYASGYRALPMRLDRQLSFMRWAGRNPGRLRLFNLRFLTAKQHPGMGSKRAPGGLWELRDPVPLVAHYSAVRRIPNGGALAQLVDADQRGVALVERADWSSALDPLEGQAGVLTAGALEEYGANSISATVDAGAAGLVVFNEVFFPGWRARVDGAPAPLLRCNHLLRGVVVDAGRHRIELSYWPTGYGWLLLLLLLSLIGGGALALGPRLIRRRAPADA
jgi:hypothetical protein